MELGTRVMILGAPGSGKSTLARALGARLGLPVFHMDHIHFLPGWVDRPVADRIALAHGIEDRAEWVFEGGLSATYAHRAARATAAVWLDLPIGLRLWRVTRRCVTSLGRVRPDMQADCPERLSGTLDLMAFMLRTRETSRDRIAAALAAAPGLPVHHLRRRREVAAFLGRLA